YEFKKKLREIEETIEQKYAEETEGMATAYRIAKTFVLFSVGVLVVALVSGKYAGDLNILMAIIGLSILTALYTAFGLFRANFERITAIRHDVIVQFLEFSRIWAPQDYQRRIAEACKPSRDLKP